MPDAKPASPSAPPRARLPVRLPFVLGGPPLEVLSTRLAEVDALLGPRHLSPPAPPGGCAPLEELVGRLEVVGVILDNVEPFHATPREGT